MEKLKSNVWYYMTTCYLFIVLLVLAYMVNPVITIIVIVVSVIGLIGIAILYTYYVLPKKRALTIGRQIIKKKKKT